MPDDSVEAASEAQCLRIERVEVASEAGSKPNDSMTPLSEAGFEAQRQHDTPLRGGVGTPALEFLETRRSW
jgi:hypothetical protein